VHLFQSLNGRDQEHGGLVELVITPGTPLDPEEGLVVPLDVHPRDHICEEVPVVGDCGRIENFRQAVGRGPVAMENNNSAQATVRKVSLGLTDKVISHARFL
jgi:hypothetical protein